MAGAATARQPAPVAVAPTLSKLADAATLGGIVLFFTMSSMLLFTFGLRYEAPGGSALEKIHPGTLLVLAGFLLKALALGNPLRMAPLILARRPELVVYLATWALLMAQAILVQKIPFTPLIDTFLLPFLAFPAIATLEPASRRLAERLLHGLLAANALLGLAEFLSGWRLTPYYAGTVLIEADWRSTALLGHPLANAMMTGVYAVVLARGGGSLAPLARLMLIGLQVLAMAAFGGRAALVMMLLILAMVLLGGLRRGLGGARFDARAPIAAFALLPLAGLAVYGLIESGFLDRLLERFVSDQGSAGARIAIFSLFAPFPLRDILLGPDPGLLETLRNIEGLEFGIESFPIGMVLSYGLLVSAIFFVGLAAFCVALLRETRAGTLTVLVFFFIVAATSVSLSAKTVQLAQLTIVVLILLPRRRTGPATAG
jgi:hypothetical protein